MKTLTLTTAALALAATTASAAPAPTLAQLGQGHRLLIVSGPAGDSRLAAQRATLAAWRKEGQDRDVVPVVLDGSRVEGASDSVAAIRARYGVPGRSFSVVLIGKDGHVAFRSSEPVAGARLDQVIDAMPMRRAGQR